MTQYLQIFNEFNFYFEVLEKLRYSRITDVQLCNFLREKLGQIESDYWKNKLSRHHTKL